MIFMNTTTTINGTINSPNLTNLSTTTATARTTATTISTNKLNIKEKQLQLPSTVATPFKMNSSNNISTITITDDTNLNEFTAMSGEEFIVLPGPDDILIYNSSDGVYQHSVTLTARMWPPIEATPENSSILGLPIIFWGIIIGFLIIIIISSIIIFLCCWLLPRKRKFLSPTRFCATTSPTNGRDTIMAHRASVVAKPWGDTGHMIIPMSIGLVPPQYSAPPPPPPQVRLHSNNNNNNNHHYQHQNHQQQQQQLQQQQQQQQHYLQQQLLHQQQQQQQQHYQQQQRALDYPMSSHGCNIETGRSNSPVESKYSVPDTHKSMWAINPLYTSNTVLYESEAAYKSRSLPSWGKSKQRPISTADDLDELYAKVNFSKKRRNRMRNGEAAIIALCRSRSQNLQGLALERDGVVIYDERTAL